MKNAAQLVIVVSLLFPFTSFSKGAFEDGSHSLFSSVRFDHSFGSVKQGSTTTANDYSSYGAAIMYNYAFSETFAIGPRVSMIRQSIDPGGVELSNSLWDFALVARASFAMSEFSYFVPEINFGYSVARQSYSVLGLATSTSYSGINGGLALKLGNAFEFEGGKRILVETGLAYDHHFLSKGATKVSLGNVLIDLSVGTEF